MRIAINYRHGVSQFKTGIAWYTYNLVHKLAEIDRENSYILYDFKSRNFRKESERLKSQYPEQKNFTKRVIRIHNDIARRSCGGFLPLELFIGRADIVHIPHTEFFRTAGAQLIVTVHDLIPLLPEAEKWSDPEKRRKGRRKFTKAVSMADGLISVSEYTKNDIVRHLGMNPSRISVVPLGADDIFKPSKDMTKQRQILHKYGISGNYLFFAGLITVRKNLARLLSAFEKTRKHIDGCQLVITGRRGHYDEFFDKLSRLPDAVRKDVILTEYVPLEDLPYLYSGASISVYPSLYEGFGLPILEAMACGCPVITSNISSMPEIAGGAALLVDPYCTEEMATAIERVLSDQKLRERMREMGIARAREFSWENTARKTLRVYQEVYEGA